MNASQQVWRVRHRLHAAGDDDVVLTRADQLVGVRDGVEAGQAHLVEGHRRHRHRDAGVDRGLPRGDLTGAGLEHLAHDDVLDLLRRHTGPLQSGSDRHSAELGSGELLQPAEQAADGRTSARNDHRSSHHGHSIEHT